MLLLLLACTGETDTGECLVETGDQIGTIEAECACETPEIEVGTTVIDEQEGRAVAVFASVDDKLRMVHGDQGGWHVEGAVRLWNTRSVVNLVSRVVHPVTGVEVGPEQTHYVQLVDEDTCQGSFPGITLFLFTDDPVYEDQNVAQALSCESLKVEICAEDSAGRSLCGEETWEVWPDQADVDTGLVDDCE